jgi:hypothetical protein
MYKCIGVGNKIGSDGEHHLGLQGWIDTRRALDTAFAEQSAWRGNNLYYIDTTASGVFCFSVQSAYWITLFWHTSRRKAVCFRDKYARYHPHGCSYNGSLTGICAPSWWNA